MLKIMDKKLKDIKDLEFYISTKNEKKEFIIYESEIYKLSEFDLINLIKICLIEARSKSIGKKILEVYRDSTEHRQDLTEERLNLIGVQNARKKPTIRKKSKTR